MAPSPLLGLIYLLLTLWNHFQSGLSSRSLQDGTSASPFMPTVVPLAVRSPYLGAFLAGGKDKDLTEWSPRFWTGSPLGWSGLVRVDGQVYNWMGNLTRWPSVTNTHFALTASSSNFTFAVGGSRVGEGAADEPTKVVLNVSFLSPLTPSDSLRQSLPLSYVVITLQSADGLPHQVELYTDVNGLWCADNEELVVQWDSFAKDYDPASEKPGWRTHSMSLKNQHKFVEEDDRILHGAMQYSALNYDSDRVLQTYSIGEDVNATREVFAQVGRLDNQANHTFRPIRTRSADQSQHVVDEPVLAYAHSFGYVSPQRSEESRSVLLSIGHIRTPAVQYMTSGEVVLELEPLWTSKFSSVKEMVEFHLFDYPRTRAASQAWDAQLSSDAQRVHGQAYAEVLAISTRQIFMALEAVQIQASPGLDGGSSVETMMMLKEISSNGNCQTVDVITPMIPFFVYSAPGVIPQLLEPILRYVMTGLYRPIPTPHDLGDHYPNATGRNDYIYSNLPLEESGNILNLALSCLRLGTCKDQVKKYHKLLVQWSEWLVGNTLYPDDQRSTDDFFGPAPNQTSLAAKGILGLRSMSELCNFLGETNYSTRYREIANQYSRDFLKLALADDRTHLVGSYGNQSSWSTQYNLFFDKLYGFKLFPDWVYDMQDNWYVHQAGGGLYGPPLDSRSRDRAKTDWLMWAAAASTNKTRDMFVNAVSAYFKQTENMVFGDLISLNGGWSVGFLTRPVVGGHFALLALDSMSHLPSSSRKLIFGTVDVNELLENLDQQRTKVLEYGRSNQGKGAVVFLALVCLLFTYGIGRRYSRRRSRGKYRSVSGLDDQYDEMASQIDYCSTRGRSRSNLSPLMDLSHGKRYAPQIQQQGDLQVHLLNGVAPHYRNRFEIASDVGGGGDDDNEEGSETDWDIGLQNRNSTSQQSADVGAQD